MECMDWNVFEYMDTIPNKIAENMKNSLDSNFFFVLVERESGEGKNNTSQ